MKLFSVDPKELFWQSISVLGGVHLPDVWKSRLQDLEFAQYSHIKLNKKVTL